MPDASAATDSNAFWISSAALIGHSHRMAATMVLISASGFYQTNVAKAPNQSCHVQFQQCCSIGMRFLNKKTQSVQRKMQLAKRGAPNNDVYPKATRSQAPIACSSGMTIIFVATEVHPWCKTGGLGDVVGGLPPALAAMGHRVMTIAPRYDQYKDAWDTDVQVEVNVGDRIETVRFFHCYKRGVDRVFVDHPVFLEKVWGKTGAKLYGPTTGTDYRDNQLRFCLLSLKADAGSSTSAGTPTHSNSTQVQTREPHERNWPRKINSHVADNKWVRV